MCLLCLFLSACVAVGPLTGRARDEWTRTYPLDARGEARALDLEPSPAAVEHLRQHGDERAVPAREVTRVEDEAPDALVERAGDGVRRRKAAPQSPGPCDPHTHGVRVDAGRGQRRLLHPTGTATATAPGASSRAGHGRTAAGQGESPVRTPP